MDYLSADLLHSSIMTTRSPVNMTSNCEDLKVDEIELVIAVIYGIICFLGLLGNLFILGVILFHKKMRSVTNIYIFHVSLANLVELLTAAMKAINMVFGYWPFNYSACIVYMAAEIIYQLTCGIFFTLMSVDQLMAAYYPIIRSPCIAGLICLVAWMAAAALSYPVFGNIHIVNTSCNPSCKVIWPDNVHLESKTTFLLYKFLPSYILPVFVIIIFYLVVLVRMVAKKSRSVNISREEKPINQRKSTKLVLVIITIYIALWFPHWTGHLLSIFLPSYNINIGNPELYYKISDMLGYINCLLLPFLCLGIDLGFRKGIMLICCKSEEKPVDSPTELEEDLSNFSRANIRKNYCNDNDDGSSVMLIQDSDYTLHHPKKEMVSFL